MRTGELTVLTVVDDKCFRMYIAFKALLKYLFIISWHICCLEYLPAQDENQNLKLHSFLGSLQLIYRINISK